MRAKKFKTTALRVIAACLLFGNLVTTKAMAQQKPLECGKYVIKPEVFSVANKVAMQNNATLGSTNHYLIRVYFHIVRYDNGSNAGATAEDIAKEFAKLQADYSASKICFLYAGLDNIYSTKLDTVNADAVNSADLFRPYLVPNCINVFYTLKIGGNNYACGCGYGGIALDGIPGRFCLVAKGNIGGSTISHEVGHCFGLLHTFETFKGFENIDGSNATKAGDLISDTPADPYAYRSDTTCFKTSADGCTYQGKCKDPKGQTNFSPPYTNMMSYWRGCYTNPNFTSVQLATMYGMLDFVVLLQETESPDNVVEGPNKNYSSGYYMSSAYYTYTTSGAVSFSGSVKATIGGNLVKLENGFNAAPAAGGLVAIRASSCNTAAARTNSIDNAITYQKEQEPEHSNFKMYPNPTSGVVQLEFTSMQDEANAVVHVYNTLLQEVRRKTIGALYKGRQTAQLDLNGLPAGTYILDVQLKEQRYKSKVILMK